MEDPSTSHSYYRPTFHRQKCLKLLEETKMSLNNLVHSISHTIFKLKSSFVYLKNKKNSTY